MHILTSCSVVPCVWFVHYKNNVCAAFATKKKKVEREEERQVSKNCWCFTKLYV